MKNTIVLIITLHNWQSAFQLQNDFDNHLYQVQHLLSYIY